MHIQWGGGGTLWMFGGEGVGPREGVLLISSDRDDWMGWKIKPKKNPMLNFWAIKIYYQNYVAGICKSYHESSDRFEYPKDLFLNQATRKKKKTCQNFPTQKNPLVIPVTWNLQYPPPPLGVGLLFGTWNSFSLFYFLNAAKSIELACKCLSMVSLYWMIDVIHPINNFFSVIGQC